MVKCVLDKQYNNCPHLGDNQECKDKGTACGMRETEKKEDLVIQEGYVRQKRWYEDIRK